MKNFVHTDIVFRNALKHFEAKPPADAWHNINNALNQKHKQRKIAFFRLIAASIAIFITFAGGYMFSKHKYQAKENMNVSENRNFNINSKRSPLPDNVYNHYKQDYLLAYNQNKAPKGKTITQAQTQSSLNYVAIEKMPVKKEFKLNTHQKALNREIKPQLPYYPSNDYLAFERDENIASNTSWLIGGEIAPLYSFRQASNAPQNFSEDKTYISVENQKYEENGLLSYSGGIKLGYQINNRLTINSGVYYAQLGQQADNVSMQSRYNNVNDNQKELMFVGNTSAGVINTEKQVIKIEQSFTDGPQRATTPYGTEVINVDNVIQNFNYLEIPLIAKYKIIDTRFDVQMLGGVNTGVLIGNSIYTKQGNTKTKIGETQNLNQYLYNTIAGLGFEYNISKHLSWSMEPTVKYAINSISYSNAYDYKPYSFGLFTGLLYKIK